MAFTDYETEQLRKALLKETRHCAVTLGMKKTSVEQLTKAAGIAKGSFYSFWKNMTSCRSVASLWLPPRCADWLSLFPTRVRLENCIHRCWKRWCMALAGCYSNKRKAAEMRLFLSN